ncbi:hypothetical protein [Bacteroides sp.]
MKRGIITNCNKFVLGPMVAANPLPTTGQTIL